MGGDCPCSDGKDAAAFRECGPGLSAGTGDLAAFCETGHQMFAALSDVVLEMGVVVYGAGYGEGWNVMHKRAETKEARDEMRGSKYV